MRSAMSHLQARPFPTCSSPSGELRSLGPDRCPLTPASAAKVDATIAEDLSEQRVRRRQEGYLRRQKRVRAPLRVGQERGR